MNFSPSNTEAMVADACRDICKRLQSTDAPSDAYYSALDGAGILSIDLVNPDEIALAQAAGRALGEALAPISLADELEKRAILRELAASRAHTVTPESVCVAHRSNQGTAVAEVWRDTPEYFLINGADDGWKLIASSDVETRRSGAWETSLKLVSFSTSQDVEDLGVSSDSYWEAVHLVVADAEMLGAAGYMFAQTLQYTEERFQFDRPIGSFQAVQHRLADHYVSLSAADVAVAYGGFAVTKDPRMPDRGIAWAHASHAFAAEACFEVAKTCVQYHGGLSFTTDFWVHHWLRRVTRLALGGGTPEDHYVAVGQFLGTSENFERFISI